VSFSLHCTDDGSFVNEVQIDTQDETEPYSFGMVGVFDYGNNDQVADLAMDLDVGWNRLWFDYSYFHDSSGELDAAHVAYMSTVVDTALAHNIKLFCAVTMYDATWDSVSGSAINEANFQLYENFLGYLVTYFKGRIDYWEIGNEPEVVDFWKPAPNAVIYTQLLQRAYAKVKSLNPQAKVIGLSSVSSIIDFIEEAFQNDALQHMDILGLHPYCYLDPTYKSIFEISYEYTVIDDIRDLMVQYSGTTKPIWVTEVGYPDYLGTYGVSEQRQAEMLVRSYMLLIQKDIPVIAWYTFINNAFNTAEKEDNFGILTNDLVPKKAFAAYRSMVATLKGYSFTREVTIKEKCKAMLYTSSGNSDILVAWSFDETPNASDGNVVVVNKNIQLDSCVQIENISDIDGNSLETSFNVELSSSPIYIIGKLTCLP